MFCELWANTRCYTLIIHFNILTNDQRVTFRGIVANDHASYFILYSENQCISKLDKIGIFIDMKFH